jgi:hypothetical protein
MEIDQPRPIIWNEREYKLAMIIQTFIQFIQDIIIKWYDAISQQVKFSTPYCKRIYWLVRI